VKTIGKKSQSRNDQRSNAKNPNNPTHKDDADNRSRQLNPKDEVYEKSREEINFSDYNGTPKQSSVFLFFNYLVTINLKIKELSNNKNNCFIGESSSQP